MSQIETRVINLYGGPGTGKSTSAALIFAMLKMAGANAELVREYVKEWAWEGRKPSDFDQLYFMGKQIRKESMLYGKVSWIVTDSPVSLGVYYSRAYSPKLISDTVYMAASNFYNQAEKQGVKHFHVFLKRTKLYNPLGRYQTEEEAREIDPHTELIAREFGDNRFFESSTSPGDLLELLHTFGLPDANCGAVLEIFREDFRAPSSVTEQPE